jgi:ribosomal protein S27E
MSPQLDGNMLAGPLSEVYGADLTADAMQCSACGSVAALATARVFVGAGLVVRCRTCGTVLATVLQRGDRVEVHVHALRGLPDAG